MPVRSLKSNPSVGPGVSLSMRSFVLACLFISVAALAAPAGRDVVYPREIKAPVPTFDKGYLITWDRTSSLSLYGPDGQLLYDLKLAPPGEPHAGVMSAVIDTDGTVAAAYEVTSVRGGVALVDATGRPFQFLTIAQYVPAHICFAGDHSIWTIGNMDDSGKDYAVIRKYSRDLRLLGEFVPRSELGPTLNLVVGQAIVGHWQMRASKDRIGACLDLGYPRAVWIELDLDGTLAGKWEFDRSAWRHGAFTPDGTLYAQKGRSGGIAVLNRASGEFEPVTATPHGWLLGAEGEDLVYFAAHDHLQWVHAPDLSESAK